MAKIDLQSEFLKYSERDLKKKLTKMRDLADDIGLRRTPTSVSATELVRVEAYRPLAYLGKAGIDMINSKKIPPNEKALLRGSLIFGTLAVGSLADEDERIAAGINDLDQMQVSKPFAERANNIPRSSGQEVIAVLGERYPILSIAPKLAAAAVFIGTRDILNFDFGAEGAAVPALTIMDVMDKELSSSAS